MIKVKNLLNDEVEIFNEKVSHVIGTIIRMSVESNIKKITAEENSEKVFTITLNGKPVFLVYEENNEFDDCPKTEKIEVVK